MKQSFIAWRNTKIKPYIKKKGGGGGEILFFFKIVRIGNKRSNKKEKKEIETELKARGERNRAKRQGYTHSHFSLLPATSTFSYIPSIGGFYSNFESIPNFNSNVDEETLVITGGSLVVAGLITYVITNDATGFGVADDWALLVLIPLFILLGGES